MKQILKRNGVLEEWDVNKIEKVIKKALKSVEDQDYNGESKKLTEEVVSKFKWKRIIPQEYIQDIVENVLMDNGYRKAAKNFILYREKRRIARETGQAQLNIMETMGDYISRGDWRIKENSNIQFSFQGLLLYLAESTQSKYCLNLYPENIRNAHNQGFIHIHDLGFGLAGYCAGWSLEDLLIEGLNNVGYSSSAPPRNFATALNQMVNFLGTLQNEWAGAQAFNNIDTYLAPYIRYNGLTYKEVYQNLQSFIFNLNTTSRWGGQSPFTNVTLDVVCPEFMKNQPVIFGGELQKETYGQFQKEMDIFNMAFLDVLNKGDKDGRIFSFPIPTYNITKDFPWDTEFGDKLAEMTGKYGVPYFQNFINSDLNPEDVRSMCCRLRLDRREILKKTGGIFGSGSLTGSQGVVTLNLARLGYLAKDREEFLELVRYYANLAKDSLEIKRKNLEYNLKHHMFPWTKRYLKKGFKGHFSTIGVCAGHEACLNLLGKGIDTDVGKELMLTTLNSLKDLTVEYQETTGNLYNLEATPAEGCTYRFAKLDKKFCPNIIQSGRDIPFYTNSTQLPVDGNMDVIQAVLHQSDLQEIYTGGTVFHTFLGESVLDKNTIKNYINKVFFKTKMPYLSITPTFSVCPNHGYIRGGYETCPECGEPVECFSRIVGYYRKVSSWNISKQEEFKNRRLFKLNE
jgi:ribonucleoside-triphosphate reductase